MVIEISFPRGGRIPSSKPDQPVTFKKDYDLFGRSNKIDEFNSKSKRIKVAKEKVEPLSKDIEATSAELISYRSLKDGMVLLGCIREVQKMTLGINLPGRLSGRVMVTQISSAYTELLHKIVDDKEPEEYKTLRQIFTVGQYVAVKVVNIDGSNENYRIGLSMMPQDVNSQLSHSYIQVGMLLWGAISSVEEHGYVVDLGINNCRSFLNKSNMDDNKSYVKGEVGWFVVQKCESIAIASTVTLNSMTAKLETMKVENDVNLDHLLPGMKIDFTVSNRLNNGLEGKFLNDYTGYIHISHLKGKFESLKNYSIKQNIEARVLYVMPITKLTYFTLQKIDTHYRGNIADGTLTTCTVVSSAKGGIYVLIGKSKNIKGFVSFRRLKTKLPFNGEMDDFALLRRDYPNNSTHKCRILSYDYLEQIYICSLEKELIESIVFSLKDLKCGQDVNAIIKEIQPDGLLMQVDNVQCFIRNIHLADVVVDNYTNIKSKYKVGQTIKAKVWMINTKNNNCHLTIKPSLMAAESILTSYDQAHFNNQYLGVVKQISTNGLLIEFGNVFGWVTKYEMSYQKVHRPDEMFKIGQVVKCTVIKVTKKRLTLSLQPPKITSKKKLLNLGQHVDAIITNIIDEGIEVKVNKFNIPAIIPLMYITKFPNIAHILAGTYKIGHKLTNLVCINPSNRIPILSIRDAHLYEDNIPQFQTLQINTVLPCSIKAVNDIGMFVKAPIKNFHKCVAVPSSNISNIRKINNKHVKTNQYILAKILNIANKNSIEATVKLNECWNFDLNESVQLVEDYLEEIETIKNHLKLLNKPLASLHIGEIVTGVIQGLSNTGSYIVDLKNGAKANVQRNHVKEKITVGTEVKGIVLWTDFINDFAEISLCTKLMTRINNIQDGKITIPVGIQEKQTIRAEVLLVKEDFVIVVLRGHAGNRQIVYLPGRLHTNDFFPDLRAYVIGNIIKISLVKKENKKIYGLLKQLLKDTNKMKSKLLTPMIQLQESKIKKSLDYLKENKENSEIETEHIDEIKTEDDVKQNKKKAEKRKNSESSNEETVVKHAKNNLPSKKTKKNSDSSNEEISNQIENNQSKKSKKRKNSESSNEETALKQTKNNQPDKKSKKKNSESSNEEQELTGNNQQVKKSKKKNSESSNEEIPKQVECIQDKKSKNYKESSEEIKVQAESKKNKKGEKSKINQVEPVEEIETTNKTEIKEPKVSKKQKNNKEQQTNKTESNLMEETKKEEKNKKEKKQKTEQKGDVEPKIRNINDPAENINPILSGASNFWNIPSLQNVEEDSSGDEDPKQDLIKKQQKKKKMTPAERAEAARLEEERIRKIEIELADTEAAPTTADQFDRLLLANPNNSLMWINYMAFQLEATEIEKARAIARKALNTIEFREEQEKLNVWIAFLNLENRYGTNETFTTLLDEAVQMNDALSVYLQALNILSDSKKITEFTDLVTKVSKKFKQNFKMWTGAAEACYKCDLKEQARNLMQRSLKSLDEKQHINLLVQFAFMESRYNEPERAEALLEKVLASYPRRVDVWTSYVELLIKSDRIHIARNVLERAAGQKLPARKMKTIFSKYVQFETKYGDEDKVNKVREMAAHYVKTALK